MVSPLTIESYPEEWWLLLFVADEFKVFQVFLCLECCEQTCSPGTDVDDADGRLLRVKLVAELHDGLESKRYTVLFQIIQ